MPPFGSSFSLRPKPALQPEAPAADAAPVVETSPAPAPAFAEKPARKRPEVPAWIREGRFRESMDAPMRRGPGSKR